MTFSRHARQWTKLVRVEKDCWTILESIYRHIWMANFGRRAVNNRAGMTDGDLMRFVTMQRHADDSYCRKSTPSEARPDVFRSLNWHEVKRSQWHCRWQNNLNRFKFSGFYIFKCSNVQTYKLFPNFQILVYSNFYIFRCFEDIQIFELSEI